MVPDQLDKTITIKCHDDGVDGDGDDDNDSDDDST